MGHRKREIFHRAHIVVDREIKEELKRMKGNKYKSWTSFFRELIDEHKGDGLYGIEQRDYSDLVGELSDGMDYADCEHRTERQQDNSNLGDVARVTTIRVI